MVAKTEGIYPGPEDKKTVVMIGANGTYPMQSQQAMQPVVPGKESLKDQVQKIAAVMCSDRELYRSTLAPVLEKLMFGTATPPSAELAQAGSPMSSSPPSGSSSATAHGSASSSSSSSSSPVPGATSQPSTIAGASLVQKRVSLGNIGNGLGNGTSSAANLTGQRSDHRFWFNGQFDF
jgi:hypothetical protein